MENVETDLFGTLLKQFRQRGKLTQLALAYKIGKHSRGSVQAWESSLSRTLPGDRETVLALAHALQLKESETDRLLLAAHYPPEYHTQGSQFSVVRAKESLSLVDMDISEHYEASVLDITLHNSGTQTALPTRLQVDILDVGEFYDCDEDDEDDPTRSFVEVSNTYDVKLSPALKGKQVSVKIAHQLRADEVDRFQVTIGPGFINAHLAYAWYYVKITILCSEPGRTLELDSVLLSFPPVAVDTDITDVWMALDTRCAEQNRTTLRRMSNLSAHRSASVEATIHEILGG